MTGEFSVDVIEHYDKLIEEGNDPFFDPKPLRDYMDKWDGQRFIDALALDENKTVLEIGVGTGRLGARVCPCCKSFVGIDISPKTVERAKENLAECKNAGFICGDFLSYDFSQTFDVIYSSLTFMHVEDKQAAINKVSRLLNDGGIFVLSIDKNQSEYIDVGTRRIKIYPDTPENIRKNVVCAGMTVVEEFEAEFAQVLCVKFNIVK